jgi:hypothetical protein
MFSLGESSPRTARSADWQRAEQAYASRMMTVAFEREMFNTSGVS